MTFSLTEDEIRLLKELRAAGERGRPVPQAPMLLARLIKVAYVERRVIEGASPRYVITDAVGRLSILRWRDAGASPLAVGHFSPAARRIRMKEAAN